MTSNDRNCTVFDKLFENVDNLISQLLNIFDSKDIDEINSLNHIQSDISKYKNNQLFNFESDFRLYFSWLDTTIGSNKELISLLNPSLIILEEDGSRFRPSFLSKKRPSFLSKKYSCPLLESAEFFFRQCLLSERNSPLKIAGEVDRNSSIDDANYDDDRNLRERIALLTSAESAKEFYRSLPTIESTIYCYRAHEISLVLRLRRRYVDENILPPFISLQEMLVVWEYHGIVRVLRLDDDKPSVVNHDYAFISHMHGANPDRMGDDVKRSIASLGDEWIWMDLCSMCQDHPLLMNSEYSYENHTRPLVKKLHMVMIRSAKGYIMLNDIETCRPDPLQIRELFDAWCHFMRNVIYKIKNIHSEYEIDETYDFQCLDFIKTAIKDFGGSEWFPDHQYYGRLWCYVERLGMRNNKIYQFPGKRQINIDKLVNQLFGYLNELESIVEKFARIRPNLKRKYENDGRYITSMPYTDLESAKNLLVDYKFRCCKIFGYNYIPNGDFSSIPATLGPFAQLALLDCYCDADRVDVARIEANLRNMYSADWLAEWTAGLQLALGAELINPRSGKRAPIGRAQKVSCEMIEESSVKDFVLQSFAVICAWTEEVGYLYSGVVRDETFTFADGQKPLLCLEIKGTRQIFYNSPDNQTIVAKTEKLVMESGSEGKRVAMLVHMDGFQCCCHFYSCAKHRISDLKRTYHSTPLTGEH